MKIVNISKSLKTRQHSGLANTYAYINNKEVVVIDFATHVNNAEKVINDPRLRTKLINELGYDIDDENIVNMLIGYETKSKLPMLFHINDIPGVHHETDIAGY